MRNLQLVDGGSEWSGVAAGMDVAPGRLHLLRQVHGVAVAVFRPGDGARPERAEADIAISDDPAAGVVVRVADCAPVLLADRRLGAVGAVHAGWRGTARGASAAAVAAMVRTFGSRPADILAAIGPCLGPCCGEVGFEVLDVFHAEGGLDARVDRWFAGGPSGRPHLDLWTANRDQLERAGVPSPQVFVAALCTRSHPDLFHSYRAHGAGAGRMAAAIRARR